MELQIRKAMKRFFGYDEYKPGQEAVVKSILQGRDTVGVMPTGGANRVTNFRPCSCPVSPGYFPDRPYEDQVDALNDQGLRLLFNSSGTG